MIDPNSTVMPAFEVAKYLGVSSSTLAKWRLTGTGPEYIKLGRRVVYKLQDVEIWLDRNKRQSTSQGR